MGLRREVPLSRRSCHVIVVGKGEATLVLPRLLGSKGDAELAPNSPPTMMVKSRLPKRTCTPGTQLTLWLAI